MKTLLRLPFLFLKLLVWLLVILVPLIGVWVASSLAAYFNGPVWLAVIIGLLLFPAVPLIWDIWASGRFEKKQVRREENGKERKERVVTFWDRMILRTFFLNIGFIAALLATYPQAGFTALASRGDWFLQTEIVEETTAEQVRPLLFASAEKLEWVYEWSRENPYEKYQDDEPLPTPTADEFGDADTKPQADEPEPTSDDNTDTPDLPEPDETGGDGDGDGTDSSDDDDGTTPKIEIVDLGIDPPDGTSDADATPDRTPGTAPAWPMHATLHPAVQGMPESVKTDYGEVARYIKEREDDPFLRVKALHDFVADRTSYDAVALARGDYPPQDAKTVFDTKKAVCAGYSKLLAAMGKVTGDEILYITGVSRDEQGGISGGGHAWNAAKIQGKWYLIDATWNAGSVNGTTFKKSYRTNYLFTPPTVFSMDHLPDEEAWQLRQDPITRGDFVRQPMLRSEFYAQGLNLVSPNRSQFESNGPVIVEIANPRVRKVIATMDGIDGTRADARCQVTGRGNLRISCPVPSSGKYHLKMFAGPPGNTTFPMVGKFEVIKR